MQLKLKRSQREGGTFTKTMIFCLDARVELTAEEQASVNRYKLGGQMIYNSQAAKKHLDKANEAGAQGSYVKSLASVAMAALQLNISVNGLVSGTHVECKDLEELLAAEEAIMTACQNLKGFLTTAATFDGREMLFDFDEKGQPKLAAPSGLAA